MARYVKISSVLAKEQRLKTLLPENANFKMSGLTHTLDANTTPQSCFNIIKPTNKSRIQDQYDQVCSMLHKHPDSPTTHIQPLAILNKIKDPMKTVLMKTKNLMGTIMRLWKTKNSTASPGRILTKDTAGLDTRQDQHTDSLLTCTRRQIEVSIAYNRYHRIKASSNSSQHI